MSDRIGTWVQLCDGCMRAMDKDGNPVEPDLGWEGRYPQYSKLPQHILYAERPEPAHCPECGHAHDEDVKVFCAECMEKQHGHRK